jgi:hypothetical protein
MTVGKMIELLAGKVCNHPSLQWLLNAHVFPRRVYWRASFNMVRPLEGLRSVPRVSDSQQRGDSRSVRLSGRRYVSHPYRPRVQLRRKGHAYQWYHRRATRSVRLLRAHLLPSEFGYLIDRAILSPDPFG